jgi:transposase InsO family protein
MITGMRRAEGWPVNHKRVERIWKQEGLKVPKKQPKRGRIWLNDGSCIRLRPLYKHHVWSYDFVADRTHDGRPIRMLAVLDEYSRECLAIKVARNLKSDDVLEVLKREIFFTLAEAKVLTEQWRREYNTIRPHSSLGYRPPAPEAIRPDPAFLNLPALRGPHPTSQGGLD